MDEGLRLLNSNEFRHSDITLDLFQKIRFKDPYEKSTIQKICLFNKAASKLKDLLCYFVIGLK
jgi:hypothetical protein